MRLVQGRSGWWCIGSSGVALLPGDSVEQGNLVRAQLEALTATGINKPRPIDSYALTVLTSTVCNLGCPYCFQNTARPAPGRFPQRIRASTLTPETIASIVGFVRKRMDEAGLSKLYLLLFGGEPLVNPDGCRELLRQCGTVAELTSSMISNATLLRRSLAIDLHRLGLRSVQVTLDGPPSIHDAARRTRHGTGTFQRILDNVANAQQATGLLFTIRINVTAAVLPDLGTLIQHLGTRLVTRRCRLQIAFLQNDHTFDNSVGLPPDVAAQVVGAYEFAAFLGFRTPWPTDNKCVFCAERNGRFGAVVNADGALFSSWESAGRSGLAVGSVEVGYRNDVPDRWRSCSSGHPGQQFTDAVDAGLLDLAWRRKRGQSCHR